MPFVYCDPSTLKIINVTKSKMEKKGSRIEIEKEPSHPAIKQPHLWQLNKSKDDLELFLYNFVDDDKKMCAIVEVLHQEIKKQISIFPDVQDIKEKIQQRYEEL